jgi:hypothetical protein
MHPSSVYGKLHVANRTELAAAIPKYAPDPVGPAPRGDDPLDSGEQIAQEPIDA